MLKKGTYVGEASTVVRWSESHSHNVQPNVLVEDADVECGEDYMAVIESYNGQHGTQRVAEFEVTIHKGEKRISVPGNVIEANDELKPGRSIRVLFYDLIEEVEEETKQENIDAPQISDSFSVLGRGKAGRDTSASDDVGSSLYDGTVADYLQENGRSELKFRNTETDEETVGVSHSNYDGKDNRFCFPVEVRKDIDTSPGDLIEVITLEADDQIDDSEKLDKVYEMVSEMYDAYLENTDD